MKQSISTRSKIALMATLLIGSFVTTFAETLLNNALPTIARELNVAQTSTQWLSTGYMLVAGIVMPTAAFFTNRFKLRPLFLTTMSIFLLGLLLSVTAPNFTLLLIGRLIQGIAVGISMPLAQNVLTLIFPKNKRGLAMGIAGIVINLGPALGPTISGLVVDHYSWRMLFLILIPLVLLALVCGILFVKNITPNRLDTLDVPSLISAMLGFGMLLFSLSELSTTGTINITFVLTFILSIFVIIYFCHRQFHVKQPLLDLHVFASPAFRLTILLAVLTSVAVMAPELIVPLFSQNVARLDPALSGLMLFPCAALTAVFSPISGRIYDKIGIRKLALGGLTLAVLMTIPMAFYNAQTNPGLITVFYAFRGIGITLVYMPVTVYGLNALSTDYLVHGSTIIVTTQQLASSLGTALAVAITTIGTLFTMQQGTIKRVATVAGYHWAFIFTLTVTTLALCFAWFLKNKAPIKSN